MKNRLKTVYFLCFVLTVFCSLLFFSIWQKKWFNDIGKIQISVVDEHSHYRVTKNRSYDSEIVQKKFSEILDRNSVQNISVALTDDPQPLLKNIWKSSDGTEEEFSSVSSVVSDGTLQIKIFLNAEVFAKYNWDVLSVQNEAEISFYKAIVSLNPSLELLQLPTALRKELDENKQPFLLRIELEK